VVNKEEALDLAFLGCLPTDRFDQARLVRLGGRVDALIRIN
jgi:hypothetical protein